METYDRLVEKWSPVLNEESAGAIGDKHKKAVTAAILENTEKALNEQAEQASFGQMNEDAAANNTTSVANWNPVLISLVRRSMPNLMAYDICGVQPMTGPTGLIFAMRSRKTSQAGAEVFYNEADTTLAGTGAQTGSTGGVSNTTLFTTGTGMDTGTAEDLGDGTTMAEMAFSIEKVAVTAKSRALKAEYTTELAQDLKAVHGLDAETELANILQSEILVEINRELVRTIYQTAKQGATGTSSAGIFDLDVDANGRWSVEKFKGLMFQVEQEANAIAKGTRRGKGNIVICSSDVASALQMAGVLDYAPALNSNSLSVDDTGNTFAGVLNGRYKVYVDPYAGSNYMVVGYKGSSAFDAGLFYCPYVPLQMVRAVGENSFQPKIGFKTRYGMVANPFAEGTTQGLGALTRDANEYYRRVRVSNLF